MKTWYLWVGLALLVLLLLSVREGFAATATIKDPSTWDAAETARVRALASIPAARSDADIKRIVGRFWGVWSAAESQITLAQVTEFVDTTFPRESAEAKAEIRNLLKAYYIDQGQDVFQAARGYSASAVTTPPADALPPVSESVMADLDTGAAVGAAEFAASGGAAAEDDTTKGKTVQGPASGGRGDGGNSTGGLGVPRNYPVLYGGMHSYESALPSSSSLGTDPTSKFLPFSRVPGDQDLYPDPYRLGKYFSSSSYSDKDAPEPAPFLADFSKFFT
jgi:hypothetical protein